MSLEAQTAKCLQYVAGQRLLLGEDGNSGRAGVFIDGGESAYRKLALMDRSGGRELLAAIRPGDHVICTSPHRMFRNLMSAEQQLTEWSKHNIVVHFVDVGIRTDTINGRLVIQLLGAVAEWKSKVAGARVTEAHQWRKRNAHIREVKGLAVKEIANPDAQPIRFDTTLDRIGESFLEDLQTEMKVLFTGKIRAYIRVSTGDQSVEAQKQMISDWLSNQAEYAEAEVVWYEDHGYSAFKKRVVARPAGKKMMEDLAPGDLVVCLRADRICRSMSDILYVAEKINDRKACLLLMDCGLRTDTVFGRLMMGLLGFVAQIEVEETRTSTLAAKRIGIRKKGITDHEVPAAMARKAATRPEGIPWFDIIGKQRWQQTFAEFYRRVKQGASYRSAAREVNNDLVVSLGLPECRSTSRVTYEKGSRYVYRLLTEVVRDVALMPATEERRRFLELATTCRPTAQYRGPIHEANACRVFKKMDAWIQRAMELNCDEEGLRLTPLGGHSPDELKTLQAIAAG